MTDAIIAGIIGFVVAILVFLLIAWMRAKSSKKIEVHSSIVEMKSVGELTVFKLVTKEIVTAAEHWLGDIGKNYLSWLISTKKMAMIFEFGIDFKYDLRSADFEIVEEGEGRYRFKMPKCFYETYIRDISFYDEQSTKLLPWLLPDLLNKALGMGFDEEDKNRLKEEARSQADQMAIKMVQAIQSEVQKSARQTLEALARGFGATKIAIDFSDSELIKAKSVDQPDRAALDGPKAAQANDSGVAKA